MTAATISTPIPQFFDTTGAPLTGGRVYFGAVGGNPETAPITVYWDSDLTQPAAQPVQTLGGYPARAGTPAQLYAPSDYSVTVKDKRGRQVFYARDSSGLAFALASTATGKGAALVAFKPYTTAAASTVDAELKDRALSATRFTGVDPTGVSDSTTGLQAWIDACIANNSAGYWPSGIYKITAPLLIRVASTNITLHLFGEFYSGRTDKGVILDHSAIVDRPAIVFQGMRVGHIENIHFLGPNNFTTTNFLLASDFVTGGCRDSQYSPQCAIAIDPFGSAVPADGGYPSMTAMYAAASLASSQVSVSNCNFRNQVVAIAASPGGANTNNNENGFVANCQMLSCKVAVSFGQLNHKGWLLTDLFANLCHTVVDDWTYSTRSGSSGFSWVGGDVSNCTHVVKSLSITGAAGVITQKLSLTGVYCENIWSIGFIGDTGNFNLLPASFTNCTFWIRSGETIAGKDAVLTSFAPVSFRDCTFIAPNAVGARTYGFPIRFYHSSDRSQKNTLSFDQCTFQCAPAVLFNVEALKWVKMKGCTHRSATNKSNSFRASFDDLYRLDDMNDITTAGSQIWPGSFVDDKGTGNLLRVQLGMGSVSLGTPTVSLSNYNATFTAADPLVIQAADAIYVSTCSIERIDGTTLTALNWPIGIVKTIVGSTITVEGMGLNSPSGVLTLTCKWYPQMHGASTISTTSGSPNIVLTRTGGGNAWSVGQRIQATGIPAGASIVSGTEAGFVLTHNATATSASVRAFDADARLITATVY